MEYILNLKFFPINLSQTRYSKIVHFDTSKFGFKINFICKCKFKLFDYYLNRKYYLYNNSPH